MKKKIAQANEELSQLSPWLRTTIQLAFMAPSLLWTPLIWWLFSENNFHNDLLMLLGEAHKEKLPMYIITGVMMADYDRLGATIALIASLLLLGVIGAALSFIFPVPKKNRRHSQEAPQESGNG